MRARPLSITAFTPSTVTELSATFVARISLRASRVHGAILLFGRQTAMQGQHQQPRPPRQQPRTRACARRISAAPGRNTRMSPGAARRSAAPRASPTCCFEWLWRVGRCWIESSNRRPSERTTGQSPRYCATGAASRVADITTMRRSGRASAAAVSTMPARDRFPDGAHETHPARRRPRPSEWVGKQAPGQYALGDKPQPRARANCFLKPDLIADSLAGLFAHLPRDSTRRQSCRNPAWFEHNHFAAHNPKQRGRARESSCPRPAGLRSQG